MGANFPQQVGAGSGDVDQGQQAVGAVLVKKVVIEVAIANLPGVSQHHVHFRLGEIKRVLPQVPVLNVRIEADFFVVGLDRGNTRVATENAFVGKQDFAVVCSCIGGIGNGVGQDQVGFFVFPGWVEA